MMTLLPAVLPVGLIILIGLIAGKTLPLERSSLSQLVLYILSPALVVDSLYRTELSWASSSKLLLGFALTSAIVYVMVWLVSRLGNFSTPVGQAVTAIVMFSNTGNMGLPVVAFALGSAGLDRAIIYMIGSSVLMFCFGPAIIGGKGILQGVKLTLKLPLIWAILFGVCLRLWAIKLPWKLDQGIQQLGAAAIPIALIVLGIQLSDTSFQPRIREFLIAIAVLFVVPAIAYLMGRLLQLESLDLQVLVLQSAMPTAVNSLIIVSEFGGDRDLVARAIVTSTLMSFISLPIVLWAIAI